MIAASIFRAQGAKHVQTGDFSMETPDDRTPGVKEFAEQLKVVLGAREEEPRG